MAIFGLSGFGRKKKGKKTSSKIKMNKSIKKKAKTCEFC